MFKLNLWLIWHQVFSSRVLVLCRVGGALIANSGYLPYLGFQPMGM